MYLKFDEKYHPPGWVSKSFHFQEMVSYIFASPVSRVPWQWNPNAKLMVDKYFEYDFLSVAGHGSSGKSDVLAIIPLAEFFADPYNTASLITSTSLSESRQRVWGRVEFYFQEAETYFEALGKSIRSQYGVRSDDLSKTPGELVSSSGIIRFRMGGKKDDTRGLKLVPGKESEVKDGVGRMRGFKARRMRFLVDEMSDLSHKLLDAAESNLYLNPDFKMLGAFNPSSYFDPAGVFSEPVNGWSSINIAESDGWKTKRGWCIRFDGLSSPNVIAGREVWRGLLTKDKLEDRKIALGENSPRFIEQYRGMWAATGHADCIYSEAEIIKYRAMHKVDVWENKPTIIGGFDPSFTHGGDRSVLVVCQVGRAACDGVFRTCMECVEVIYLDDNLDTTQDKKELVIQRLKAACQKHGLSPRNLAIDATGGGDVLATLMRRDPFFGVDFMRVQFGGEASELITEGRKGKDKFINMVSELYYAGKPLMRMGQLKGIKPDIVRDMTLRLYEEQSTGKKKIKVESKEDMKQRINGRSPDAVDAYMLALFVARARHNLHSEEVISRPNHKLEQQGPIDNAFSWGQKKKPRINEPDLYVPSGGGWADESRDSGFGGMFFG